ncbi:MAG: PBP1A family penicillin-binding protein [Deltaproteobacteria bacterium]|nr:PBP1A family penicillin-binding protein [Deltaproteobacteria bacterium]
MRRLKSFSILRLLSLLLVYGAFLGAGTGFYLYQEFDRDLPERLDKVLDYRPSRATRVYSADGELVGEFYLQKRVLVALQRIPGFVQQAFLAAEDRRFYRHAGFDPVGIARAAYENYIQGGIRQGASTITQQVSRMLMLSNERTLARKAKELILSIRVERELTKEQILYIYLNHVYLGHGAYGVQAAAEVYFGKDVEHLTIAEAALLAGLPKAPSKFSPYNDYPRARERQAYVLKRMLEDEFISATQEEAARKEPLALISREHPLNHVAAPYFVEHVRRWAAERYGDRNLIDGGLRIYTTLDMKKQRAAEAAVRAGLEALDRRLGFRGPVGSLVGDEYKAFAEGPPRPYVTDPGQAPIYAGGALLPDVTYVGTVTSIREGKQGIQVDLGPRTLRLVDEDARRALRWHDKKRRLAPGDLISVRLIKDEKKGDMLAIVQAPNVQGALVAVNPTTGDVAAMVGGYDYRQSQFNRATQARRQAGSSIKPFIYATALDRGFTELSIVPDAPIALRTASGIWAPQNYKREYLGPLTLKIALAKSINTISVRLVAAMGVEPVIKTMRSLGITSPIPRHISISLGSPDVSLLEMTCAYATFPNGGKKVSPRFVTLVTTDDGRVIEDARGARPGDQVLRPAIAYLMVDLMKGVVMRGTGRKAQELGRPAGGKTGTSTGFRDAWFIAFTADLVAGVWVGRDNFKPIGYDATGGQASLPIWLQFMRAAHPDTPARDFEPPPDVTFVRANDLTGQPAAPGGPDASWVPFARGTIPPHFTHAQGASRFSTSAGFP